MSYKHDKSGTAIIRLSDNAVVPLDPRNTDYIQYLEWANGGGITAPYKTPQELEDEAIEENNNTLKAQMLEDDLKIIRALVEGDKVRIDAHKVSQSDKRRLLVPPGE